MAHFGLPETLIAVEATVVLLGFSRLPDIAAWVREFLRAAAADRPGWKDDGWDISDSPGRAGRTPVPAESQIHRGWPAG